jgi:hypothetical protein
VLSIVVEYLSGKVDCAAVSDEREAVWTRGRVARGKYGFLDVFESERREGERCVWADIVIKVRINTVGTISIQVREGTP